MNTTNDIPDSEAVTWAAALAGDEAAWTALSARYQQELRVHCYRMLGSFSDAEDMVQETLIRAWRRRETFQGRSTVRAWLYGIATNACLDYLDKNQHRIVAADAESAADAPWLQPYPDRLLDEPETAATAKQTIGIAFLVAMQFLPAKQRAALILSEVLDWSVKEIAALLELSVPSVNSALQRARETLRKHQPQLRPEWKPGAAPDEQQRAFLTRYVTATERGDVAGLTALLQEDVRFSMPPEPGLYAGRDNVVAGWLKGGFGADWFGTFRCRLTRANRMPAVACYLRKPGATNFRALALDVLEIEDALIKEITTFSLEERTGLFDLPPELP
jgi:RNA polymerase sigma-70 factor (ECF subfamily)